MRVEILKLDARDHRRESAEAAESGLLFMKREVDGIKITVVGRWIVKKYAGGKGGCMASYNGRYRSKTDFGSPYYELYLKLYMFYLRYSNP